MTFTELQEKRARIFKEMKAQVPPAGPMTKAQVDEFDRLTAQLDSVDAEIAAAADSYRTELKVAIPKGGDSVTPAKGVTRDTVALSQEQRFSDWLTAHKPELQDEPQVDMAAFVRAIATGDWDGISTEIRQISSYGSGADGAFTVPEVLAGTVIDLIRDQSRVAQAGATVVPMTSRTLSIARLAGVPDGQWRAEHELITPEDITFDRVQLEAKGVATLVKASWEWLEDTMTGFGASQVIGAIAESLAQAIDSAALYGEVADEPPQKSPIGLYSSGGPSVLLRDAVSNTPTNYDFAIDAITAIRGSNLEPNAIIFSPTLAGRLAKMKTGISGDMTTLVPPAEWTALNRLTTNKVDDPGDAFIGAFSQLIWGQRSSLTLRLDQRFAELGQVGFIAQVRADFAVARDGAFVVHGPGEESE